LVGARRRRRLSTVSGDTKAGLWLMCRSYRWLHARQHRPSEAAGQLPTLGSPKSAASERTITLPHVVVDVLARQFDDHPPIEGMVWTTEKGGFLRRGSFSRIWRKAVTESVRAPCRVHDLRHTHASWLIAAGERPKSIQTRLGHSSIQVTIDRYGHLMDGLDHQTAVRLDAIAATVRGPGAGRDPPAISL